MKILYTDEYCCDRCNKIKPKNELSTIPGYPNYEICQDCRIDLNKILFDIVFIKQITLKNRKKLNILDLLGGI